MTAVLQERTISMILTVPNVKELSCSMENLDHDSKPPAIPIYRGSIIHIEQHRDDLNKSDLIVRVPDFDHLSTPSLTISINTDRSGETDSQREVRTKRRAPICPIINENKLENCNVHQSELSNTKRLAIALRQFRQTVLANRKAKRSTNINPITIIPVLPDVEIIREDFQVRTSEKKSSKNANFTSKFFSPKILFIKRKKYTVNKNRPTPENGADTQMGTEENGTDENPPVDLQLKENEIESNQVQQEDKTNNLPMANSENEEQSTTIAQLIPKIPIFLINPAPVSDLQAFESNTTTDLITDAHSLDKNDNAADFDDRLYIVQSNDDICSECYEVIYEFDHDKEQIYLPEVQDRPSVRFNFDPVEYQDPTSSCLSIVPSNDYEQIDSTQNARKLDHSEENFVSRTDSSLINEEYTVILQLLKHALQIESIPDEDCHEFNQQIKELFRSENLNELE